MEPKEGDTITRIAISECTYVWKGEGSDGDWYVLDGPRIVYEHPKWKDIPGAD